MRPTLGAFGRIFTHDLRLRVVCANSTLDVLPIALNTRIEHIRMSFNKIRIVDASFQVTKSFDSLFCSQSCFSFTSI